MTKFKQLMTFALAVAATESAFPQAAELPKEIAGRWTMQASGRTQTFSIEEISAQTDGTFRAKLTWWTSDPKCLIKNEPIIGKFGNDGISFDAKNKCDVSFTTILGRDRTGWTGTATTTSGPTVVLDLKAN